MTAQFEHVSNMFSIASLHSLTLTNRLLFFVQTWRKWSVKVMTTKLWFRLYVGISTRSMLRTIRTPILVTPKNCWFISCGRLLFSRIPLHCLTIAAVRIPAWVWTLWRWYFMREEYHGAKQLYSFRLTETSHDLIVSSTSARGIPTLSGHIVQCIWLTFRSRLRKFIRDGYLQMPGTRSHPG